MTALIYWSGGGGGVGAAPQAAQLFTFGPLDLFNYLGIKKKREDCKLPEAQLKLPAQRERELVKVCG